MNKFIVLFATIALFCTGAKAGVDFVSVDCGACATNAGAVSVTNSFASYGRAVSITFYCSTNSTGTVSTVSGIGTSRSASKVIAGPIVLSTGQYTTNLANPTYLVGDKIIGTMASTAYLVNTGKIGVVLTSE